MTALEMAISLEESLDALDRTRTELDCLLMELWDTKREELFAELGIVLLPKVWQKAE
jgi:hypothetical protein